MAQHSFYCAVSFTIHPDRKTNLNYIDGSTLPHNTQVFENHANAPYSFKHATKLIYSMSEKILIFSILMLFMVSSIAHYPLRNAPCDIAWDAIILKKKAVNPYRYNSTLSNIT